MEQEFVTIEFRNKFVVAHEVVFPEDMDRNMINSFRFILKSWIYHKDMNLLSLDKHLKKRVSLQLGLYKHSSKKLNYELAVIGCEFFQTNIAYICQVASVFEKCTDYNAVYFNEDNKVIFVKSFKHDYGA